MKKVITNEDIKKINELYLQVKTYAGVSRILGFAPSTIKKYVVNDFQVVDESKIQRFTGDLPEFKPKKIYDKNFGELCVLSDKETNEIKELWEELEI